MVCPWEPTRPRLGKGRRRAGQAEEPLGVVAFSVILSVPRFSAAGVAVGQL